jgi:hypothetical protein
MLISTVFPLSESLAGQNKCILYGCPDAFDSYVGALGDASQEEGKKDFLS